MTPTPFPWPQIAAILSIACLILFVILLFTVRRLRGAQALLDTETFNRQSLSATYGRITEQWFPLMDSYPYDPQNFRFLGSPIDGVQFEEDRIVFIEFKANRSRLSDSQKRIKRLVESGEVYWDEFHFTEKPSKR